MMDILGIELNLSDTASLWLTVFFRCTLAVLIGSLIGSERARHGRAAGMRTHILVCLGAALTSMMGIYLSKAYGSGDIFRISAQVISGVGFLGAGMIVLKNNNTIIGLTTAAGVWTTSVIGIAIGYGFYAGAIITTVLFLSTIVLFARFERRKKATEVVYLEIDDMYRTNTILQELKELIHVPFAFQIIAPKSKHQGHLGVTLIIERQIPLDMEQLCRIENIVYAIEE